ncbi:hypothetical protein K432DRAFT_413678 [Lepidopterella palustris CBS 459.81]|uniref:Uncharacterized protein n=1 Tax=Lepidopterella palustris CBS 459.81 TaxID=1314670 RepID=A0A8E2JJM5_9PEZI|nr:hypothetical protein K432DRAFT_413678 [Lepidopterella palustris CBS 459.81]
MRRCIPGRRLSLLSVDCFAYRTPHSRLFSTLPIPDTPEDSRIGPLREDGGRSVRVRKWNNRPLPIPPLLDPIVLSARERWEKHKPDPDPEKFTPFQQKLYQNPYAHLLATPVRACPVTFARIPSAFLITLHLKTNPHTSDPWVVPVNVTSSTSHHALPVRCLGYQSFFYWLTSKQSNWKRTLTIHTAEKLNSGAQLKKVVWREDMPALILFQLQKYIFRKLRWYFVQIQPTIVRCRSASSEDINDIDNVSCILYLRSMKSEADDLRARSHALVDKVASITRKGEKYLDPQAILHVRTQAKWWGGPLYPRLQHNLRFPPLYFPTAEWRGHRVSVYSLYDLLGEERMRELVAGTQYENADCVVMKADRKTVSAQMALMRLQTYVADPAP